MHISPRAGFWPMKFWENECIYWDQARSQGEIGGLFNSQEVCRSGASMDDGDSTEDPTSLRSDITENITDI